MKNLFILFLFAFVPSSFIFGQQQTAPGGSTSCSADCLFTSCTITCSYPNGGGICTCAWGFASCACGGGGATVAHVDANYQVLNEKQVELNGIGEKELASLLGNISSTAKRGGDIRGLIEQYQAKAEALPSDRKARVIAITPSEN